MVFICFLEPSPHSFRCNKTTYHTYLGSDWKCLVRFQIIKGKINQHRLSLVHHNHHLAFLTELKLVLLYFLASVWHSIFFYNSNKWMLFGKVKTISAVLSVELSFTITIFLAVAFAWLMILESSQSMLLCAGIMMYNSFKFFYFP
jgi:hypothetical protein